MLKKDYRKINKELQSQIRELRKENLYLEEYIKKLDENFAKKNNELNTALLEAKEAKHLFEKKSNEYILLIRDIQQEKNKYEKEVKELLLTIKK